MLTAAFVISQSLANADSYERISAHVGCHTEECTDGAGGEKDCYNGRRQPTSYIGGPSDVLPNTEECTDGDTEECVSLGKKACDQLASEECDCWGFAVSKGRRVQMYNSKASDSSVCSGTHGLDENSGWTSYQRVSNQSISSDRDCGRLQDAGADTHQRPTWRATLLLQCLCV